MVKKKNPTTPGQRFMTVPDFQQLTRKKPERSLTKTVKRRGGRNNHGRITARHRGGGSKRQLRLIDFRRLKDDVPARVAALEYDPNRSARIALLHYRDGEKAYILAPQGLEVGQEVISGEKVEPRVGNCLPLRHIPLGMSVHNVELQAGRGGQIIRSAGTGATLSAKEGRHAHLVLPSGEIRKVPVDCRATVGLVGNSEHSSISVGKAGRNRWLGWRPYVRGVAMNPVAHPMGGGEGRSSGGRHPCSPQGRPAKGGKTRARRKASNDLIIRRRKKKR